jgi:hypothetical protein
MASSITRLDYYQSKLDHVKEMLNNLGHHKQLDLFFPEPAFLCSLLVLQADMVTEREI